MFRGNREGASAHVLVVLQCWVPVLLNGEFDCLWVVTEDVFNTHVNPSGIFHLWTSGMFVGIFPVQTKAGNPPPACRIDLQSSRSSPQVHLRICITALKVTAASGGLLKAAFFLPHSNLDVLRSDTTAPLSRFACFEYSNQHDVPFPSRLSSHITARCEKGNNNCATFTWQVNAASLGALSATGRVPFFLSVS